MRLGIAFPFVVLAGWIGIPGYAVADEFKILVGIEGDRREYDKLQGRLAEMQTSRAKLDEYIAYKRGLLRRKLEDTLQARQVASGEKYQAIANEEAKEIIKEGVEGIKTYLTADRYKRLEASQNAINQVNSLEKIKTAEGEYIDSMDYQKVSKLHKDAETILRQLSAADQKLGALDRAIESLKFDIQSREVTLGQALRRVASRVGEIKAMCDAQEGTRRSSYEACGPFTVSTTQCTGEGPSRSCQTVTSTSCVCSVKNACTAPAPHRLCTCPVRWAHGVDAPMTYCR